MNKKIGVIALAIFLLLLLLSPGLVQANSGLRVIDSSVEAEFPLLLNFNLSAESDVNITDVRLHYTIDRESFAQVTSEVYIDFVPDTNIDVRWALDMRKTGGLPPESNVEYWWTLKDDGGNKVVTTPARVSFNDDRYPWQRLTEGKVTVYWYKGDRSFFEEIMLTAQQALARLAEDTGAYLTKPVKIYIYANAQDLQGAMIFPQEWTGGVSYNLHSIIAIGIAPNNLTWGKRATTHELTHLVIHQMTYNPFNWLPIWLDEGLAMHNEGTLESVFTHYLNKAVDENSLISVRSLSSPFSAHSEESYLSYAQSYSLIDFLITSYGQDKMFELLNTFREGSSYDGALEKVYGFDMDGLNGLWQEYIKPQYQEAEVPTKVTPVASLSKENGIPPALAGALAGVLGALFTALFLLLSLTAEKWAWRRGR